MSIKSAGPWAQAGPGGQPKHQKHEQLVVVANHENPAKERQVDLRSELFTCTLGGLWGCGELGKGCLGSKPVGVHSLRGICITHDFRAALLCYLL